MDKKTAILMMQSDFARFSQEKKDFSKKCQELEQDTRQYIKDLLTQIKTGSNPVIAKTPKPPKRKNTRIQAIPENEEMETDSSSIGHNINSSSILEVSDVRTGRAKRGASIKAADNIKKQQSISLVAKLRRPSKEGDESLASKIIKESRSKRPKESFESSEEEDIRPSKQIKTDKKKMQSKSKMANTDSETDFTFVKENQTITVSKKNESLKRKLEDQDIDQDLTLTSEKSTRESSKSGPVPKKAHYSNVSPKKQENSKYVSEKVLENSQEKRSQGSAQRITRSSTSSIINGGGQKNKKNFINETVDSSNADETLASMYEDAIGKPLPIMNSTMNPNSTVTIEKMMNVTVLIEPMSKKAMNETVTIKKSMFKEPSSNKKMNGTQIISEEKISQDDKFLKAPDSIRRSSRNQKTAEINKKANRFNDLITDDESSPERKGYQSPMIRRNTRSNNNSLMSDEDEVRRTPTQINKQNKDFKLPTSIKSAYKPAALFSPYAKDSVKKRVEAFEQVAISPQKVESEVTGRVTRTKTRALAAASDTPIQQTVTQKLARKSLARAKKISLAKHTNKEYDDVKENENTNIMKSKKTSSLERSAQKPQPKTTPLGKSRLLQVPSSANKNQFATPSNAQIHNAYSKPLTASRGNIVTHVDSFIQPMKSASKPIDKSSEERKRRVYDEDARRKREDLLKAQAEEKRRRREEKELKNKLAREAKEKFEYEKRLRAEREKEEKARLAQQMQEKQKEEIERKRIAQMQRAQEKEERRKQEELLRMQRLQEQEEQERLLAEQKRREQELEKRKQAELRHQLAELKMQKQIEKAALQAKQAKALAAAQKQAAYNNYKIDSDPDEEDTDDECKPKHQIPHWALRNVRQTQLAMQQYIPMKSVLKFFDAKKCTPDLRDLFKGIDPKKLKRTSSAIWKTPPRFSMMDRSIIKD